MGLTDNPDEPCLKETLPSGQQKCYLVLSEEERAKGFVRPLRRAYRHVGLARPDHPLRDLTPEQHVRFDCYGYVKFEPYDGDESTIAGRYWTQQRLDRIEAGCGTITRMGLALCETYARQPDFYGGTFCCGCGTHLPVEEFVWEEDGERVGS